MDFAWISILKLLSPNLAQSDKFTSVNRYICMVLNLICKVFQWKLYGLKIADFIEQLLRLWKKDIIFC